MATNTTGITPGSGLNVAIDQNASLANNGAVQIMALANPDGSRMPYDPDGTFQVSNDSKALFFDAFDVSLSKWATGGTAPSISSGMSTFASSTTASAASYMRTNGTFILRPQAYLRAGYFAILTETTTAITNNTRWWGYGQNQGSPTAASPVLNGAVFTVDYADGLLYGATYSAGTRTQRIALTRPTDGGLHKYEIWFRQAVVYFLIDGNVVGSITYPNTAVASGMYLISGSINHTTAPSTAPVLRLSSASMSDTSGTVGTIGDGIDPYLQSTVKSGQSLTVATTDNSLSVLSVPVVGQVVTGYSSSAAAVSATVPAPGANLRNYITSISIERFALAALTASATPLVTTASNHGFVMTLPADAAAQGTKTTDTRTFPSAGIASSAQNTATVFTAPSTTNVSWRVTVTYYIAP